MAKTISLEAARAARDAYELCIYKALRASGATKEQAEHVISGYYNAQILVDKYVKSANRKKPAIKSTEKEVTK